MNSMQGLGDANLLAGAASAKPGEPAAVPVKKYKKRQDKANQDKVSQQVPDSPALCILVEHQQRLDDLLSQRRAAIRETLARPDRVRTRLRITITHVTHPPEANEPPSWSLLVHGRTLDSTDVPSAPHPAPQGAAGVAQAQYNAALESLRQGADPATAQIRMQLAIQAGANPAAAPGAPAGGTQAAKHPLTNYLRKVEVRLQPSTSTPTSGAHTAMDTDGLGAQTANQGGEGERVLVWDRAVHLGPHKDCVEVRFQGCGRFSVGAVAQVRLTVDGQPERFLLPAPLDTALGTPMETRPRVMQLLALYLKKERLMDADQMVTLKGAMAEALGTVSLPYHQLQVEVLKRLQQAPSLHVDHFISAPGHPPPPGTPQATVFDVECDTLGPINLNTEKQAHALFESLNPDKELEPVEAEMATVLKRLAEHRRRRAMLMGLAQVGNRIMAEHRRRRAMLMAN